VTAAGKSAIVPRGTRLGKKMSIKGEFSGQRHPVNAQVPLTAYVFESFHRSNCSKPTLV
jgi:hypothetical protein